MRRPCRVVIGTQVGSVSVSQIGRLTSMAHVSAFHYDKRMTEPLEPPDHDTPYPRIEIAVDGRGVITIDGEVVHIDDVQAKLTEEVHNGPNGQRRPDASSRRGFLAGQIKVPADFDTMMQDEIIAMFEGEPDPVGLSD